MYYTDGIIDYGPLNPILLHQGPHRFSRLPFPSFLRNLTQQAISPMPPRAAPGATRARGGPDRGAPAARGRGGAGRGGARGGRGGTSAGSGSAASSTLDLPSGGQITTVGVKRPDFGKSGRPLQVFVNCFNTTVPDGIIYHYDGV